MDGKIQLQNRAPYLFLIRGVDPDPDGIAMGSHVPFRAEKSLHVKMFQKFS